MDAERIAELLQPFLDSGRGGHGPSILPPGQLQHISTYIDLLLCWNLRVNLTSVRNPEEIVTRHFGESLFTAQRLFPNPSADKSPASPNLIDVGSGAGFPGLPIKIWAPAVHLTLIESNQKKATFLREVVRALTLIGVDVFAGRVADFENKHFQKKQSPSQTFASGPAMPGIVVTLRAVEHFDAILPAAAGLLGRAGRLAILIGQGQLDRARQLLPLLNWDQPIKLPHSSGRFLLLGTNESD
jgi:16S rRNA (guanine527-N7)-methyltransferase